MTDEQKQQLGRAFLSVLGHPDAEVVRSVAAEDVVWSFPGASPISGEAHGVEGVMKRGQTITSYGVRADIIRAVHGFSGMAMILHNTGNKNGRTLDEHVVAVFSFRGDKISRLARPIQRVDGADGFRAADAAGRSDFLIAVLART
jgi:ketosteroid isomerase-like protein